MRVELFAVLCALTVACEATESKSPEQENKLAENSLILHARHDSKTREFMARFKKIPSITVRRGEPQVYSIKALKSGQLMVKTDPDLIGDSLCVEVSGYKTNCKLGRGNYQVSLNAGQDYDIIISLDSKDASVKGIDEAQFNIILTFYEASDHEVGEAIKIGLLDFLSRTTATSGSTVEIVVANSTIFCAVLLFGQDGVSHYDQDNQWGYSIADYLATKSGGRALTLRVNNNRIFSPGAHKTLVPRSD